jgi:hypothetical protein
MTRFGSIPIVLLMRVPARTAPLRLLRVLRPAAMPVRVMRNTALPASGPSQRRSA